MTGILNSHFQGAVRIGLLSGEVVVRFLPLSFLTVCPLRHIS
jgi:hypothetical protein